MLSPSSEGESSSSPELGSESRGSSVSSGLREEYEDLLRYAVVTPVFDGKVPSATSRRAMMASSQPPRPSSPLPGATRTGGIQPELSKIESESSVPTTPEPQQVPTPSQPPTLPSPSPPLPQSHSHAETMPTVTTTQAFHHPPPSSSAKHLLDDVMGSHDQSHDLDDVIKAPGVDPEMVRLETQLDTWCLDLKRNIMAEFAQSRIRMQERYQADLQRERRQHAHDLHQLQEEVERHKELAATYEQSVTRKDHIIASLTSGLQKQKERVELQRSFSSWKIKHTDEQRESFTTQLSRRHYHHRLKERVWGAWFGVVQGRWKDRVERACQSKAEEVCVRLTEEYEEKLAAVHRSLDESHQEIARLKAEKELYEENMKKAFMRGVCALNLEAMTMFRQHDSPDNPPPPTTNGHHHSEGDVQDGGHTFHHLPPPPSSNPPPNGVATGSNVATTQAQSRGYPPPNGTSLPPPYLHQLPSRSLHSHTHPHSTLQLTLSADQEGQPPSLPHHTQGSRPQGRPRPMAVPPSRSQASSGRRGGTASGPPRRGVARGGRGPSVVVERHVTAEM